MITLQQTQFLSVLKAALWNEKVSPENLPNSADDWNRLIVEAQRQTVAPLLFDWIQKQPSLLNFPIDKGRKLLALSVRNGQMHIQIRRTLKELDEQLRGIGVNGVLLKGEGVATVYPRPDARACGDIDFYVGKENYAKVHRFIREKGWMDDSTEESEKHLHYTMNNIITVEIHWVAAKTLHFWSSKAFDRWLASHIKPRKVMLDDDMEVHLPDVTFDAFFLFYHAYYHFLSEGVGLRQFCDWALFLDRYVEYVDINALKEVLSMLNLQRVWTIFGTIVVKYLGLSVEKMPFYNAPHEDSELVLEVIFEDGNFGQHNQIRKERPKGYYSNKFFSLKNHIVRSYRLIKVARADVLYHFLDKMRDGIKRLFLHK